MLLCAVICILVLCLPVGLILRRMGKPRAWWTHLLGAGFAALSLCAAAILLLGMVMYSSLDRLITMPQAILLLTIVPAMGLVLCLVLRRLRRKYVLIPLCCLLAIGAGLGGYTLWEQQIPVVSTTSVSGYSPYSEAFSDYALDEPSTLRLSGDLPRLDGATALYPVYAAFYRAVYPTDVTWSQYIHCSTTRTAWQRIVDGSVDIIFTAEASEAQAAAANEQGVELVYTPLGSEAFVFIVNERNPLENITIDQLRDIYSGRITSWDQLGVSGLGSIRAFQRAQGSGSQTAFIKFVARDTQLMTAPTEMVEGTMGGLYEKVADYRNFRNAIGYSFRYYCTSMLGGKGIKLLSINGISPTPEHIADGTYPLSGQFYAVTRADAGENVQAFLTWMTGSQGQELIRRVGYTPLNP